METVENLRNEEAKDIKNLELKERNQNSCYKSINLKHFKKGWIKAGGHDGEITLEAAFNNACTIYLMVGRAVSWEGLGTILFIAQQQGRELEYNELKFNDMLK